MSEPARCTPRSCLTVALLGACMLLAGCASVPPDSTTQTKDPWEKMNRAIYAFNDKLDKDVARPVATAYVRAVPTPARNRFHDFISNLGEPIVVINDALQGKFKQALQDTGRFLVNTTVGLVGFFDPASDIGLPHHDEDLGQTLAHWGVPSGPYLVLPVLGPEHGARCRQPVCGCVRRSALQGHGAALPQCSHCHKRDRCARGTDAGECDHRQRLRSLHFRAGCLYPEPTLQDL